METWLGKCACECMLVCVWPFCMYGHFTVDGVDVGILGKKHNVLTTFL